MFNHQARWDRNLPQDNTQKLGVAIAVTCLVDKGRVIPKDFAWNNHTYNVETINFRWKNRQGRDTLLFFSVTTPEGVYEIAFSCQNLSWYVSKLIGPSL